MAQTSYDHMMKFFLGGFACMVAAVFTNPIDVIKVRLQLQGELQAATGLRFLPITKKIISEEGVMALYKGIIPSLLREGSYSTLRMGFYEPIKFSIHGDNPAPLPLWIKIVAGAGSGVIGSAIANPTDLVKVRMQAEIGRESPRYKNTLDAFRVIFRDEGLAGLYRGVVPTTQRAMILTASQLPSYDHTKATLLSHGFEEGTLTHAISSMVAGLICSTTTSPVDLVKSRYMNQAFHDGKGLVYRSVWDCIIKTVKAEGVFGLYKGWLPNWLRIGPHTVVTFMVLEKCRQLFGIRAI